MLNALEQETSSNSNSNSNLDLQVVKTSQRGRGKQGLDAVAGQVSSAIGELTRALHGDENEGEFSDRMAAPQVQQANMHQMNSNVGGAGGSAFYGEQHECSTCGQMVFGESVQAMDKFYHPQHFCCANCQQGPLDIAHFYALADEPHCERCYLELSSSMCGRCQEPVKPAEALVALNQRWHKEHFVCAGCLHPFPNGVFFTRDGQPHCERCISSSGERCAGCDQPIASGAVQALGRAWHAEHFKCATCRVPLAGQGLFFERNGRPFCQRHYEEAADATSCATCGDAVQATDEIVRVGDKTYHVEHFKCYFCFASLAQQPYSVSPDGANAYCEPCFEKIF
jgi:paxillin